MNSYSFIKISINSILPFVKGIDHELKELNGYGNSGQWRMIMGFQQRAALVD
jgi:hypothetical protein